MPDPIGFIGLGNLGLPIATNVLALGHPLRVYNRTPDKAAPLVARGATLVDAPSAAATRGGIVFSVVSDDAALEAVADDKLAAALGPGGVHVSVSTVLPATSRKLAEHHRRFGATFLAAPIFARPEAAAARTGMFCVSGNAEAKARVRPLLESLAKSVYDFGDDVGAANVVKLAGNFMLTAAIEIMAEAAALAENNGIPRARLLEMFTQTLFACPVFVNYGKRIVDADFDKVGFRLPLALKDMRLALQTANAAPTPMPVLGLLRDRYLAALANGREELDASALALGAAEDAGLEWFKPG
jgi:3-hydroxyisobutyrate dehydrogenase-like beta-hydroxyacid dehydrogenase